MASSRFQLISKKLVKPFISTPPSLRNYKLSLLDQLNHKRYMPMVFFYPKHPNNTTSQLSSSLLEESLSKTLSSYYPFAGRLTENISVNCNDTGATFLEARIRFPMSEILNVSNASAHDIVFPSGLPWEAAHDQPSLLVAQLNHFDCGGIALSVCLRHNIGDGPTLCNFIYDWAAITRQSSEKPSPQFIGSSILTPIGDPSIEGIDMNKVQNCISRRFTFDFNHLSLLKAKATAEVEVQNPTRVEVLIALLKKCAMSAAMVSSRSFRPSVSNTILNLRPLIGPLATQSYAGNLFSKLSVLTTNEREINFSRFVNEIRREKLQQYEKYKGMTSTALLSDTLAMFGEMEMALGRNDMDVYTCSSLCKFPTNKIDFGWGSPIRVSLAANSYKNFIILTDIPNGDGIEALVTLEKEVMSIFQNDPEILEFSSS